MSGHDDVSVTPPPFAIIAVRQQLEAGASVTFGNRRRVIADASETFDYALTPEEVPDDELGAAALGLLWAEALLASDQVPDLPPEIVAMMVSFLGRFLEWASSNDHYDLLDGDLWTFAQLALLSSDGANAWALLERVVLAVRDRGEVEASKWGDIYYSSQYEVRFGKKPVDIPGIKLMNIANNYVDIGDITNAIDTYHQALAVADHPAVVANCLSQIARQHLNLDEIEEAAFHASQVVVDDLPSDRTQLARVTIAEIATRQGDPEGIETLRAVAAGKGPRDFVAEAAAHTALVNVYERAGMAGAFASWHAYMAVAAKLATRRRREIPSAVGALGRLSALMLEGSRAMWYMRVATGLARAEGEKASQSSVELNEGFLALGVGLYDVGISLLAAWLERYPSDPEAGYVQALLARAQEPSNSSRDLPNLDDVEDRKERRTVASARLMSSGHMWLVPLKDRLMFHSEPAPRSWGEFGHFLSNSERNSDLWNVPEPLAELVTSEDFHRHVRTAERMTLYSFVSGRGWLYFFRSCFGMYSIQAMDWLVEILTSGSDEDCEALLREIGLEYSLDPFGLHSSQRPGSQPDIEARTRRLRLLVDELLQADSPSESELEALATAYAEERARVPEFPHAEADLDALLQVDDATKSEQQRLYKEGQEELQRRLSHFERSATPLEKLELVQLMTDRSGDVRDRREAWKRSSPRVRHTLEPDLLANERISKLGPQHDQFLRSEAARFAALSPHPGPDGPDFVVELLQSRDRAAWLVIPLEAARKGDSSLVDVSAVELDRRQAWRLRASVLADVRRVDRGHTPPAGADWRPPLEWLVRPLMLLAEGSRVVLSLSQPWLGVPMENLPLLPGGRRLVDRFRLTRKDHAERWRSWDQAGVQGEWLAIGDAGCQHEEARTEAEYVHEKLGGTCLVGSEATLEGVRELARECRGLYLAGQGYLDPETSIPKLEFADGFAPVEALASAGLGRCALAILTTCLASASMPQGEEPGQTAARSLLECGARSVVASPVRVESARAALFGQSLVDHLEGRWTTEALRDATAETMLSPWLLHGADLYHQRP